MKALDIIFEKDLNDLIEIYADNLLHLKLLIQTSTFSHENFL